MTKVLIPLADGVEEMEAVILIDVLRRAGWEVVATGLREGTVVGSRGVRLVPDALLPEADVDSFDALVLPGGSQGTAALAADQRLLAAIRRFVQVGKWVGAICAAPLVLQAAGVLAGRRATCHPEMMKEMTAARLQEDRVVIDDRIVTSRGPGTAFEFCLSIIGAMAGAEAAARVAEGLVLAPR